MPDSRRAEISNVVSRLCKTFHERLRLDLDPLGLFKGQPHVINLLWAQDGLSQGELGEAMRLQPATVTKMVQRMESAGFVERRPDERDHRVSRVYLTEKGRGVKPKLDARWEVVADDLFAGFSAEEVDQLEGLLRRAIDNLMTSLTQD
jgi:DNA-binding MarR family transcriptional regulator